MLAHELMTRRPVTGTPRMPIRRALAVLRRGRFRHLPILDDGRLRGVLSDRDLQEAIAAGRSEDEPVAGLVRSPAITAAPDTPAEEIARLLLENKIGCLPIVELLPAGGETLAGIVTESDVLAAFVRTMGSTEPGSRVVVWLQEPTADLLRVARVLVQHDAPLLALSTAPPGSAGPSEPQGPPASPSGGPADAPGFSGGPRLRLILRLGTIDPRPIEAAIAAAGLELERPVGDARLTDAR